MKKKLTALTLSIIMLIGLMAPAAYAAESITPASGDTAASQEAPADTAKPEATPEQMLMLITVMMQLRNNLPVEQNLDGLMKTMSELKAEDKTIQVSSEEMLSIFFYTIEHGINVGAGASEGTVQYYWDYVNADGNTLRIIENTQSPVWQLTFKGTVNKTAVTRTVSLK